MAILEKDAFKYCPVCGHDFITKSDIEKDCSNCGYIYFISTNPSTSGIIIDEDKAILFITRGRNPHKGAFDIPAGFADYNETIEDALKREMNEEVGLDINKTNYKYFKSILVDYEFKDVIKKVMNSVFIIKIDGEIKKTLKSGDDVSNFIFIKPEDIDYKLIGFEEIN